jgi:putative NIF3 family GTP cyclohydrolase 1 type 2
MLHLLLSGQRQHHAVNMMVQLKRSHPSIQHTQQDTSCMNYLCTLMASKQSIVFTTSALDAKTHLTDDTAALRATLLLVHAWL